MKLYSLKKPEYAYIASSRVITGCYQKPVSQLFVRSTFPEGYKASNRAQKKLRDQLYAIVILNAGHDKYILPILVHLLRCTYKTQTCTTLLVYIKHAYISTP